MLFDVEEDSGARIVGYLVPDSFSGHASVRITSSGREVGIVETSELRPAVVAAGRHETGQCGFRLTEENVPGLSQMSSLDIAENDSGMVIYRRRPSPLPIKLFRLETSYVRLSQVDQAIEGVFQLTFPDVDHKGRETATQSFLLRCSNSILVSARLLYKEYELSIDSSFRKICILQDPCVELAETLLATVSGVQGGILNLRDELAMNEVADYFADLDLSGSRALRRALSSMPDAVATLLTNPLARLLAGRTADELGNWNLVPNSLDVLSSFDIVGMRDEPASVVEPLSELVGMDTSQIRLPQPTASVLELAVMLRSWPVVTELLELDIEIVQSVRRAIAAGFQSQE